MNRFDIIATVLANGGAMPSQAMSMHFVLAKMMSRAYAGGQLPYLATVNQTLWQEFEFQIRAFDGFTANQVAQMQPGGRLGTQIVALGLGTIS